MLNGRHRMRSRVARRMVLIGWCCLLLLAGCENRDRQTAEEPVPQGEEARPDEGSTVYLYFADKEASFLIAEGRHIKNQEDPAGLGRQIVEGLLKGPHKALSSTIPAGTRLKALYLAPNHVAVVDVSGEIKENHSGGAKSELLTVYAIVNSLVLNIPEIEAVKLLIDGREVSTLAGHIDLRFSLKANMLLVR